MEHHSGSATRSALVCVCIITKIGIEGVQERGVGALTFVYDNHY